MDHGTEQKGGHHILRRFVSDFAIYRSTSVSPQRLLSEGAHGAATDHRRGAAAMADATTEHRSPPLAFPRLLWQTKVSALGLGTSYFLFLLA